MLFQQFYQELYPRNPFKQVKGENGKGWAAVRGRRGRNWKEGRRWKEKG
jgi:hypothetical protein